MTQNLRSVVLGLAFGLCAGQPALAGPVQWTDWTAATAGAATGTMGATSVGFTGTIFFAQTGAGIDYWTEPNAANRPYTDNAVVSNRPPAAELIALNTASANTLTFGAPVTGLLMAIVSQGQLGLPVTYDFNTPFSVLSDGQGYWGTGTYSLGAIDQLIGRELHAVIQFTGTVSSISWTSTEENWHGFTVGVPLQGVPEPGTLVLLGAALAGIAYARRRLTRA